MQYRKFGKLDWIPSALGFGCMRLPVLNGDSHQIDEAEATRMIRHAIDQGVNYIDTAYGYHGGNSEKVVGRVLKDGYREKVRLATKLPLWNVNEYADFDRLFNEQLEKLQTDTIDFYLLHAVNHERWEKVERLGVTKWAEGLIRSGRIHYLGFSFHDLYPVFEQVIDAYDGWTFCQIQYNYLDLLEQAGEAGLKLAASRGLAVVIMEPLLGGRLANLPEAYRSIFDQSKTARTLADWSFQWLWNQPEISVVLSGMSTMQQVDENLASADHSGIGSLPQEDMKLYEEVRAKYLELSPVPCTSCKYCMPCPNGVNIPRSFELFNRGLLMGDMDFMRFRYGAIPQENQAESCIQCRECEEKCPQHIPISEWMPVVDQVLGKNAEFNSQMRPR